MVTSPGVIRCRFEDETVDMRKLGKFLSLQKKGNFRPYFIVHEEHQHDKMKRVRTDLAKAHVGISS